MSICVFMKLQTKFIYNIFLGYDMYWIYIYSEKIFLIQKYRSFSIQTRYLCMVQLCIFVNEFGVSNLLIQVYFYTSTSLYRSPILLANKNKLVQG